MNGFTEITESAAQHLISRWHSPQRLPADYQWFMCHIGMDDDLPAEWWSADWHSVHQSRCEEQRLCIVGIAPDEVHQLPMF